MKDLKKGRKLSSITNEEEEEEEEMETDSAEEEDLKVCEDDEDGLDKLVFNL